MSENHLTAHAWCGCAACVSARLRRQERAFDRAFASGPEVDARKSQQVGTSEFAAAFAGDVIKGARAC
jgi:hypothetical protein